MNSLPKNIFSINSFWGHLVGLPLYVFGLLLLFCPFAFKTYDISFSRYSFHVTMAFCIIIMVMLISRVSMMFLSRRLTISLRHYLLLCLFEILFSSGFTALYLWLFNHKNEAYFSFFGYSLVYLSAAMIIPYIVLFLHNMILEKENQLDDASKSVQGEKIRFLDERGNVKLIVSQLSILYIQRR